MPNNEKHHKQPAKRYAKIWKILIHRIKTEFQSPNQRSPNHNKPRLIPPPSQTEAGSSELRKIEDLLKTNQRDTLTDFQKVIQKMDELLEINMTLQKHLDSKEEEIKRLKGGYDNKVYKQFLRRFITIDKAIGEHIQDIKMPEGESKRWHSIQELLEDALNECGVVKFAPKVGEDYRKIPGIADRPEQEPTSDISKDWQIAEVLTEGYVLQSPDGEEFIVKSKVKIFRHQKEN